MEVTCQATLSDALAQVLCLVQEDACIEPEFITPYLFASLPFTAYKPEQMEDAVHPISLPHEYSHTRTGQAE